MKSLAFEARFLRLALAGAAWPRPDLVYLRSGTYNFGALLYARRHQLPCIIEVNGDLLEEAAVQQAPAGPRQRLALRLRLALYRAALGWSYRSAAGLVVISDQLAAMISQRYGVPAERIRVVTNGVDVQLFKPLVGQVCRQRLGLPLDRRYVGYIGTLAAWQDLPTLLRGFAALADQYPQVDLLIVGDGLLRPQVEALRETLGLGQRLRLLPPVPHTQVPLYLNACSIASVPKRPLQTGYSPLKAYEAMACGVPLLASDQPSLRFIAAEGAGLLYRAEDPADLARQLERLLRMAPAELQAIGLQARRAAETRHSWAMVVERVAGFAQQLLSPPGAARENS